MEFGAENSDKKALKEEYCGKDEENGMKDYPVCCL